MKTLNHYHWTCGGTGVTNFDKKDLNQYLVHALAIYTLIHL